MHFSNLWDEWQNPRDRQERNTWKFKTRKHIPNMNYLLCKIHEMLHIPFHNRCFPIPTTKNSLNRIKFYYDEMLKELIKRGLLNSILSEQDIKKLQIKVNYKQLPLTDYMERKQSTPMPIPQGWSFYLEKYRNFVNFLMSIKMNHPTVIIKLLEWRPQMKQMVDDLTSLPVDISCPAFAQTIHGIKLANPEEAAVIKKIGEQYYMEGQSVAVTNAMRQVFGVPEDLMFDDGERETMAKLFRYIDLFMQVIT